MQFYLPGFTVLVLAYPAGCHPIQSIDAPPPSSPPFLCRMSQPSQFILAWHQVCWVEYPVAWLIVVS